MGNNKYKILIVEDEANIRSFIKANLETSDYQVLCAETCALGMMMYASHHPDLIILDLGLPDRDGMSLIQEVRKTDTVPIIVLSARSNERDKVEALDLGANDYITKPFNPVEVLARVKSQLRRFLQLGAAVKAPSELTVGGIALDHDAKRVTLDGEEIALTPKEYDILYYLMQHPGKVFTPAELYSAVWNEAPVAIDNTVAVHIRHLREKLEINPSEPRYLKVVWGKGYKLEGDRT